MIYIKNSNTTNNNNFKASNNIREKILNEEKEKNNENLYEKALQAKYLTDVDLILREKVDELLKDQVSSFIDPRKWG